MSLDNTERSYLNQDGTGKIKPNGLADVYNSGLEFKMFGDYGYSLTIGERISKDVFLKILRVCLMRELDTLRFLLGPGSCIEDSFFAELYYMFFYPRVIAYNVSPVSRFWGNLDVTSSTKMSIFPHTRGNREGFIHLLDSRVCAYSAIIDEVRSTPEDNLDILVLRPNIIRLHFKNKDYNEQIEAIPV